MRPLTERLGIVSSQSKVKLHKSLPSFAEVSSVQTSQLGGVGRGRLLQTIEYFRSYQVLVHRHNTGSTCEIINT